MSEARKVWTKGQVKKHLDVIAPALKELEVMAASGGQMPSSLRRKLQTVSAKVRSVVDDLNSWAITSGEKALAELRQEEGPREECVDRLKARVKEVTKATLPSPDLYLKDGRGPFKTVQEALGALGIPEDQRPKHNRYDRLSKAMKELIRKEIEK